MNTNLNIPCSFQTYDEPIYRWFPQTVAKSKVQSYLSRVGTRLHYQKHHLVNSIVVVPHLRCEGCWALSDVNSPSVSTRGFKDAIFCDGLDIETTEVT